MSGSSGRGIGAAGLLLDGFAGYLRSERGVTELTVDVYVAGIRRFLVDRGGGDLSELTAAEVSKAVLGQVTRWSPASVRRYGFVSPLLLRRRPRRSRPVGGGLAGIGAAAVAAAGGHHSGPGQGLAAGLRSASRQRPA
jgi:hypothetical protein